MNLRMPNNLAPIGLTVYGRLKHLQQAVEALKKNILAPQSELYVFSDAPKSGDEEKVAAVRKYLRTIDGFKKIHIIERESNNRVANSRGGLQMLLDQFGKVIFLAEDVITAPGFLTFMNQSLNQYERNNRVFSVVGYCPPIKIPADYQHDAFFLRRFFGWGMGIWKDRWDLVRYVTPEEYEEFAANKKRVNEFVKAGGSDMMMMLRADSYGSIDAGDVKAMYAQFLSDQYTAYPSSSLAANIGMDGSGTHCDDTNYFVVPLSSKTTFNLPDHLIVDPRIVKSNRQFWNNRKYKNQPNLIRKGINIFRRVINKIWRVFTRP